MQEARAPPARAVPRPLPSRRRTRSPPRRAARRPRRSATESKAKASASSCPGRASRRSSRMEPNAFGLDLQRSHDDAIRAPRLSLSPSLSFSRCALKRTVCASVRAFAPSAPVQRRACRARRRSVAASSALSLRGARRAQGGQPRQQRRPSHRVILRLHTTALPTSSAGVTRPLAVDVF